MKRALYGDASRLLTTAKHPTWALTRPLARHANHTPNTLFLGRRPLPPGIQGTLTPLKPGVRQ
jgi:hypothetical protein